jgi:hypothetical protein
MPTDHNERERAEIVAVLEAADPDVRRVANEVIRLERAKIHMRSPQRIVEDIVTAIKAAVK